MKKLIHASQIYTHSPRERFQGKKTENWTWLNKQLDAQERVQEVYFEFWVLIWRSLEIGFKHFIFQILYPQGLILFYYYWYCLTSQPSHREL